MGLVCLPSRGRRKAACAQAQGMYWFLVMHVDTRAARGDISSVKGRRIGAAPWVELGLRRLLEEAGIDVDQHRVTIAPVPGTIGKSINFGLSAAHALAARQIDGFWANGMAAEVAASRQVGTIRLMFVVAMVPQVASTTLWLHGYYRSFDFRGTGYRGCGGPRNCKHPSNFAKGHHACRAGRSQGVSGIRSGTPSPTHPTRLAIL